MIFKNKIYSTKIVQTYLMQGKILGRNQVLLRYGMSQTSCYVVINALHSTALRYFMLCYETVGSYHQ